MKKTFALALAMLAAGFVPVFAQTNIATWTFETSVPTTSGPIAAEVGTGSAVAFHSGASTYSSPAGNGSAHSFSSTNWQVGDYYQFQVSTTSLSDLAVSWDQVSSGTGPSGFALQYSLNGTAFSQASTYTVLANASPNVWSSGSPITTTSYSFNLAALTSLNNQSTVYFRLADLNTVAANGTTVASGGTDRVDNFSITAIPEPSTYALILGAGTLGFAALRRRRLVAAV